MVYDAYDLLARLQYLILTTDENGKVEFVGNTQRWHEYDKAVDEYCLNEQLEYPTANYSGWSWSDDYYLNYV